MKKNMLSDEEMSGVSGGFIFNASNIIGADPANPWEVIDLNGNVLARFNNRDDALSKAKSYGDIPLNVMEIDWNQLCGLRGQK
ncbi:MAG: hypothetical protein K6E98_10255 [Lachnospiraceae bacterium]|nr:hypothetical protein [Lachnospiraceae bacterium]